MIKCQVNNLFKFSTDFLKKSHKNWESSIKTIMCNRIGLINTYTAQVKHGKKLSFITIKYILF